MPVTMVTPVPTSMPTQVGDYPEILSYKVTSPTPVMTIPDDPSKCDTDEVPTFRYAASSGLVGKGRLCEWGSSAGVFWLLGDGREFLRLGGLTEVNCKRFHA